MILSPNTLVHSWHQSRAMTRIIGGNVSFFSDESGRSDPPMARAPPTDPAPCCEGGGWLLTLLQRYETQFDWQFDWFDWQAPMTLAPTIDPPAPCYEGGGWLLMLLKKVEIYFAEKKSASA